MFKINIIKNSQKFFEGSVYIANIKSNFTKVCKLTNLLNTFNFIKYIHTSSKKCYLEITYKITKIYEKISNVFFIIYFCRFYL